MAPGDAWLSLGVAAYTAIALLLAFVAARAWRHSGSRKVALLAAAFGLLLAKGLLFSVALFQEADWRPYLLPGLALDAAALALLYAAVLRRS